jgi:hypothetical protein
MKNIFGRLPTLPRLEIFRCDQITGGTLQLISRLTKLKHLDIGTSQCYRAEYLTVLQTLPNLVALDFWFFNGLTDEAFRSIGNISQLTKLAVFVGNGRVTPRGLDNLSNLSRMLDLVLEYNPGAQILNDHFIGRLTNLTRLETSIRGENISALTTLNNLQEFKVHTGAANQDFFTNLAKLTALSSLNLDAIIEYLGVTQLTDLNNLTSLKISRCDLSFTLSQDPTITSQFIDQLVTLTKLKVLHVGIDDCQKLSLLTNLEEISVSRSLVLENLAYLEPLVMLPRLRSFKSDYLLIKRLKATYKTVAPNVHFLDADD